MPLPERLHVKLSSEAAEAISLTRVVVQEMSVRELLSHMLAVTGKDRARIQELLRRGTLVSGASRFRWEGWSAEPGELESVLRLFPDPEPSREFAAQACVRAVLRGARTAIDVPREAALRRGFLRRATFWDALLAALRTAAPAYQTYSYRDQADLYRAALSLESAAALQEASSLLRYATLRERVRRGGFDEVELYTSRITR